MAPFTKDRQETCGSPGEGTALPVIQTLGAWVTRYLAFSEPCPFWSGGCDCNPSLQLVWVRGTGRGSGSDSGARSLLPKPKCLAAWRVPLVSLPSLPAAHAVVI